MKLTTQKKGAKKHWGAKKKPGFTVRRHARCEDSRWVRREQKDPVTWTRGKTPSS